MSFTSADLDRDPQHRDPEGDQLARSSVAMRLLVFDRDEATGRRAVQTALVAGLEAIAVIDSAAFRQCLVDFSPQIILLGLHLGDTDGVEQLRFLAERRFGGSLVIMGGSNPRLLAATTTVAQRRGLKVAATLVKPIQNSVLERILSQLESTWQPPSGEELLAAIRNNELSLDLQPIVSRQPRTLKKLEALVRWDHRTRGRLTSHDFFSAAESDPAAINEASAWAIGATLDAYCALREHGVTVPIGLDISSECLDDLELPDRLLQRLEGAEMPVQHLSLEITETTARKTTIRMIDVLSRIRLKEMHLAMDHFGTRDASLTALQQLPFSEVKIDRSFIAGMTTSRDSRAIVRSVIDLAANMEMTSTAVGVETEETAELLEGMNVDALQGHLIAPPMPVRELPVWLESWLAQRPPHHHGALMSRASPSGSTQDTRARPINTPQPPPDTQSDASKTDSPASRLSPRQLQVMQLLSLGCSVKEIARRLKIGVGTVKVHLSLAYSALGARNRVEAVVRARLVTDASSLRSPIRDAKEE